MPQIHFLFAQLPETLVVSIDKHIFSTGAAEGSVIIVNSLYGDNPIEWNIEDNHDKEVLLHLHFYEFSFLHPKTDIVMNFPSDQIVWYYYRS